MCGIVGVRDDWLQRCRSGALDLAVQRLRWRGPDGAGTARIGSWWLGCARLAITQPASGQPVTRRGGRFGAVLNGAITNARELWRELLPGADSRPEPPNDAWLPLLLVEHGRRDLLASLRGHHAFAVIDRATDELVLGQDRFGEKPLFCLQQQSGDSWQTIAFASTPRALTALGMPSPALGEGTVRLLRFGFCRIAPQRFSPALRLAEPPRQPPAPGNTSAEEPNLRRRFFAAVGRCADSAVPRGLFLSGGIDSSCIAAALRHLGIAMPAYQFRAIGGTDRERAVAREVAGHCGLELRAVDGGPEILDALPELTRDAGTPLGDPSICAAHAVARQASGDGVKVMLSGEGADELFVGYRRYRALAWLPRLRWLARAMPRWSMRYPARWLRATAAPDPAAALLEVTPPAFAALVLAHPQLPPPVADGTDLLEHARAADLEGYLRYDLLPKIDVATMAAGIESRCPWLEGDYQPRHPLRAELGKQSLRRAFAGDLPAIVFRQPKRGFGLPLDAWFRGNLPWLDLLREPRTLAREHLRPGGVAAAIDRHRGGRADLGHGLYLLVALEWFLRCQEEDSALRDPDPGPGA